MSKKVVFTSISPLPPDVTREVVLEFLHNHEAMIDLNPLVKERHRITTPPHAQADEGHCVWYSLTDTISYLPGVNGAVSYTSAFNNLHNGIQTHCYAPAGVDIRGKWTLNGSLPGEPVEPIELGIGAPLTGLYLREDVELRASILMAGFVKKTLKKSHHTLVEKLKTTAQLRAGQPSGPHQVGKGGRAWMAAQPAPALYVVPKLRQPAPLKPSLAVMTPPPPYQLPRSAPPPSGGEFFPGPLPPPAAVELPRYHLTPEPASHGSSPPRHAHGHGHGHGHARQRSDHSLPPQRLMPREQQRYSLPPVVITDAERTLCPEPLRLRNPSVAEAVTAHSVLRDSMAPPVEWWPDLKPAASVAAGSEEPRRILGGGGQNHPDYPEMNPYADDDWEDVYVEEETEAQPPPFSVSELPGDIQAREAKYGGGTGATLSGPFVAELDYGSD